MIKLRVRQLLLTQLDTEGPISLGEWPGLYITGGDDPGEQEPGPGKLNHMEDDACRFILEPTAGEP